MALKGHVTCDEAPMFFSLEALDKNTFTRIMKGVMSNMSDEMLEVLFLKVDSDCDGHVNWVRRVPCCHRKLGEERGTSQWSKQRLGYRSQQVSDSQSGLLYQLGHLPGGGKLGVSELKSLETSVRWAH